MITTLIATLMVLFNICISAQEVPIESGFKFNSFSLSTGQDPLTKGLTLILNLKKENKGKKTQRLTLGFNNDLAQIIYTWDLGSAISAGPSVGHFNNIPWVAPFVSLAPAGWVSTIHWVGVSAGADDRPELPLRFFFSYQAVSFSVKGFSASYAVQNFLNGKPTHLANVAYGVKVADDFFGIKGLKLDLSVGATYVVNSEITFLATKISLSR